MRVCGAGKEKWRQEGPNGMAEMEIAAASLFRYLFDVLCVDEGLKKRFSYLCTRCAG
jgi:hypothetical protein